MRGRGNTRPVGVAAVGLLTILAGMTPSHAADGVPPPPPKATCGPGSNPEVGLQGRVSAAEVESGRAAAGYTCNAVRVGGFQGTGGFKVERFVDAAGHECAYYDTTLVFPTNAAYPDAPETGVYVLDMADPANPVRTEVLRSPAMQSPHESMVLNQERGLLVAAMGHVTTLPGIVDVYDVNGDCRHPVLKASLPMGLLGHESGMAPDGKTFYTSSIDTGNLTAVDISDPSLPVMIYTATDPFEYVHGLSISDDGNRAYLAASPGLVIVDTSEIQQRVPNPKTNVISTLSWAPHSIGQVTIPVTIGGRPYLVQVDEFANDDDAGTPLPSGNGPRVGAARLIDISDETKPRVVSDLRLEVNQPEHRPDLAGDPGATEVGQGYAAHYCNVPRRDEPEIVACSFIMSGMRVFDIRDPLAPREIAYANFPAALDAPRGVFGVAGSAYAMSSPTFVPERAEIWYSDANTGFHVVRTSNGAWPFTADVATPPVVDPTDPILPATGTTRTFLAAGVVLLATALVGRRVLSRSTGSG